VWARSAGQATAREPAGMGVKFIEMSKKDSELLKHYMGRISGH
jgi:hypothetical protein